VKRNLLSNCVGGREYSRDIVVPESNANILSNITLLDDISACRRHLNNNLFILFFGSLEHQSHLLSAVLDLLNIKLQSESGIDRLNFDLELMIGESGEYFDLLGVFMMNLYLLNGELRVALTVRGELTGQHSEAHLQLMQVCPRHLNQHVGRAH
jgi:hypothetical protein